MSSIPRGVLSERFQEHMKGRRLKAAAFFTYCFDPAFFEQEVLPVFIDVPLSHVPTMRLIQLQEALCSGVDEIAVYYDRNALEAGAASAKLDVQRIPVTRPRGFVFHPKNVLALVEDVEVNDDGQRAQHLIVACMSANLTRSGWWENVECCHIELLSAGIASGFRNDVIDLLKAVRALCPPEQDHRVLDQIQRFVSKSITQRAHRSSDGILHPRLYAGREGLVDFLEDAVGDRLEGLNLEVISPYFDNADAKPLKALIERFRPRETRVFLPRDVTGAAACSNDFAAEVTATGAVWAELPADVLKFGKEAKAAARFVHAKVYRFFSRTHRRELLFVGSVNLTNAAHQRGCNLETGFLVEATPTRPPEWWLVGVEGPQTFAGSNAGELAEPSALTALRVRFEWHALQAFAMWDDDTEPPELSVAAQGAPAFVVTLRRRRTWEELSAEAAERLRELLPATSFLTVSASDQITATILVEEDGMASKPTLLQTLSATDILRYWSLLTVGQRTAFLEERAAEILQVAREMGIDVRLPPPQDASSVFNTFAGIYHAFATLERTLREEIADGRLGAVEYRLFGKKHDSLGSLLDRLDAASAEWSKVERYVVVLCARQLVNELRGELPSEFVAKRRAKLRELESRIDADRLRYREFEFDAPERRAQFLDWFEKRFLTRARHDEGTS